MKNAVPIRPAQQIWLVTHYEHLAAFLRRHANVEPHTIVKRGGETWIQGLKFAGGFDNEPVSQPIRARYGFARRTSLAAAREQCVC
jgi:hypothetical protein